MKAHAIRNADGSFELWLDDDTIAIPSTIGLVMHLGTLCLGGRLEPLDLVDVLQRAASQIHDDTEPTMLDARQLAELLSDLQTLNTALGRALHWFHNRELRSKMDALKAAP